MLNKAREFVFRGVDLLKKNQIAIRDIDKISIGRGQKIMGSCKRKLNGDVELRFSQVLFEDGFEDILWNVVLHELTHACYESGRGHGIEFKILADRISKLGNTEINTYTNPKYVERLNQSKIFKKTGYLITCSNCNVEIHKTRKSNVVDNPTRYYCGTCNVKNTLVVTKL